MSDERPMTCEQLDERLSEWLENDIDPMTRTMLERHAAVCVRCAGLLADLGSIRREAASLPELVPSRNLWPEIEARIQAPVIALDQPRVARPASGRRTVHRAWWLGAVAAGLVAVTAGVTHYMTIKNTTDTGIPVVASQPARVPTPDTAGPQTSEPTVELASDAQARMSRRQAPPSGALAGSNAEQSEYARDVAQLRAIVSQRRTEFDSSTIAVLEKNLELIDRAITESREALQRDPASEFLADQLARAMTKKVAILRTVALLPARS